MSNQPKLICRVKKLKTRGSVSASGTHNLRKSIVANANPDGPPPILLIGTGDQLADVDTRFLDAGITKIRKNGVLAIEVLLTASPSYFRENPENYGQYNLQKTHAFNEVSVKWLQEYFGPENLVSAVCHLDEATPHIHAIITPIKQNLTGKNSLCAKHWLGGRAKLSKLQDSAANQFARLGLERGLRGSQAQHQSIRQFYGALDNDAQTVPKPEINPPSTIDLLSGGKKNWAIEESNRIAEAQGPELERLTVQANLGAQANKRIKNLEKTAKLSTARKEVLAQKLRDIPLDLVLKKLDLKPDQYDAKKWAGPGMTISTEGKKYYDHKSSKGGGGAIDLTMHCIGCDFVTAIRWLSNQFENEDVMASVRAHADVIVKESKKYGKIALPQRSENKEDWDQIRSYLIKRGISPATVDYLYDSGNIYASNKNGYINAVFLDPEKKCAEIVGIAGTNGKRYRGLAPGSTVKNGGFRVIRRAESSRNKSIHEFPLVLTESAIEAISFFELADYDCEIVSMCGCKPNAGFLTQAIKSGRRVVIAYNNDDAGRSASNRLIKHYAPYERQISKNQPNSFNDWNDLLTAVKNGGVHEAVKRKTAYHIDNLTMRPI